MSFVVACILLPGKLLSKFSRIPLLHSSTVLFFTNIYPKPTAVTIEKGPESLNVSLNEKAIISCSAYDADVIIWCLIYAQNDTENCTNVKALDTMDSDSTINPDTCFGVNPVSSELHILIRNDLYLVNDLNDSLLYCSALSFEESMFVNSSQARLLFQGKLNATLIYED